MIETEPAAVSAAGQHRVPWVPVAWFVVLSFGLAWLVALPLWLDGGLASPWTTPLLMVMMLSPTLATLFVVFALKAPRAGRLRFLGIWPLRPAGRFIGMLAIALVAPIVIVALVALIAGAVGLIRLDLVGFSGFAEQLSALVPEGTPMPPVQVLVIAQLAMIPVGAIINVVPAAGEEIGWRGWLLTALRPLGTWPALLIVGVLWGLWHAPVILLGYNFARPDLVGLLLMVGGCVAWGVLLGWLRLRSASVWPAALAHGSLNAVGGLVVLLIAAGELPDMGLVGPLGVVSWVVLALVAGVLVLTGQFRSTRLEPVHPLR
ncbi:CPBP family intramembrane glutamic endopeptidase [Microbacterium invictum]|uniref:Membrane protease YdiL (CAAX protease family) n=1 Tax=Microbacterium invictum TaxID=515415 RepID=A0AA40SLZ7_9MICO|nr:MULTISPECIES: type II CAAX endopeptidase family protein [Microbacterium]MBB4138685.1 membrane protease YdiL (CAAX protease family) [Microbacterium invictum]